MDSLFFRTLLTLPQPQLPVITRESATGAFSPPPSQIVKDKVNDGQVFEGSTDRVPIKIPKDDSAPVTSEEFHYLMLYLYDR